MAPIVDTAQAASDAQTLSSPVGSKKGLAFEVPVKSPTTGSRWVLLSARLERKAGAPATPPKPQSPSDRDAPVLLSAARKLRAEEANKQKKEAAERVGEKQAQQVARLAVNLAAKFEHATAAHSSSVAERGARAGEHNRAVRRRGSKGTTYQEACQQRKEELIGRMRSKEAGAMQPASWRFKPSVGTWLLKPKAVRLGLEA